MARARTPIWLAAPTRFAALPRARAQLVLGMLALLIAASLSALASPGPPPASHDPAKRQEDRADVVLYESIVAGLRNGGDYYRVTAEALRRGNYPLRPFVTFRLPTLAVVEAALPEAVTLGLLYTLAAGVIVAWFVQLRPALPRPPPLAIALVLLIGGMATFVQAELVTFHEVWAGLLIAMSLAIRRNDRVIDAVATGLIAMLIRETAALYVIVMAAAALREGRRREAALWASSLVVLAIVIAAHAYAVGQVTDEADPTSPGWIGMLGFGFFVKTMSISTALTVAPAWLAALFVAFALFGWSAWPSPLAERVLLTFVAYAALLALFGRTDTFYWGLMIAPTFLVGLAFAPDGLRDLIASASARRRITVTRQPR